MNVVFCVDSKRKKVLQKVLQNSSYKQKFYSSTTKLVVAVELFFAFVGILVLTVRIQKNILTNQNHTKVLQKSSTKKWWIISIFSICFPDGFTKTSMRTLLFGYKILHYPYMTLKYYTTVKFNQIQMTWKAREKIIEFHIFKSIRAYISN